MPGLITCMSFFEVSCRFELIWPVSGIPTVGDILEHRRDKIEIARQCGNAYATSSALDGNEFMCQAAPSSGQNSLQPTTHDPDP